AFVLIVERMLRAAAVVEECAGAKQASRQSFCPPCPAELNVEIASVIKFLSQVPVHGEEGGSTNSGWVNWRVVDTKLKLPRLGDIGIECPTCLRIQTKLWYGEIGITQVQGVPQPVEAIVPRVLDQKFVSQMGT